MLASLLFISTISRNNAQSFINNDLTCDGLVINALLAEVAIPAGICEASTNGSDSSSISQCQSGSVVTKSYPNTDCSGNTVATIDLCAAFGGSLCNSYCGLGGCEYFVERTYYDAHNCSGDEPVGDDLYYDEEAKAIGYCSFAFLGYQLFENNGTHIIEKVYSTDDCSGDPSSVSVEGKIGASCEVDFFGDVEAKYIRVGTATDTGSADDATVLSVFFAVFIGIFSFV